MFKQDCGWSCTQKHLKCLLPHMPPLTLAFSLQVRKLIPERLTKRCGEVAEAGFEPGFMRP